MARVLIAMAQQDADPSEVAIPWKVLTALGHAVSFATPDGARADADELMLTGEGLDPWGFVPGLKKLTAAGRILAANADARAAYAALARDPAFAAPRRFDALSVDDCDALVLPGGHRARGMRPYLENRALQGFVAAMFAADKPVGAICHGVLVAARAVSPATGRSVLYGRQTTSLTWAQEGLAWTLGRVLRFWDGDYYRTYVEGPGDAPRSKGVEAEVTARLASPRDYRDVPADAPDRRRKTDGLHRDTATDARPAFVVRDGRYVSARWPGDAYTFAKTLAEVIAEAV
ncbi:MAG: thiJ/pfpI-family protein [Myxococcaceae bacterium]|nr:thiJ/pfpI-family protein [Myxococcaceae bacterium]